MSDKDALLGIDDAAEIGFKIVEMADRLNGVDKIIPGAQAKWRFEVDGISYDVTVAVAAMVLIVSFIGGIIAAFATLDWRWLALVIFMGNARS